MSTQPSLLTVVGLGVAAGLTGGIILALATGGSTPAAPLPADPAPESELALEAIAAPMPDASSEQVSPASTTSDTLESFRFDDLTLTNQRGEAIDQTVFDGQNTALAFFFTTCQGPCPALTAVMKRVQDTTTGSALRFLSVSVDGDNDTPEVIRAYGEGVGADFDRWTFATGDPASVDTIARAALQFSIARPEEPVVGPRGNEVRNIIHPTRILLVGPDRTVQAVYAYNDPAQVERLIARFDS
ncbi:MAG: SCO family protein [Planctomycetota bacterium]